MTVEAAKRRVGPRPRPRVPAPEPLILALDLGASRIRAAAVDTEGRLLARDARVAPVAAGPEAVLAACVAALEAVRASLRPDVRERLVAIGAAAPGPLDAASGYLLEPPNLGPAFRDLAFAAPLADALRLPVALERDTNVAALAEGEFGAARGESDYLYLTVSSGIGGAIVSDGRLFRGADGLAGELGHVSVDLDGPPCGCGGRGHLEAMASGLAIARAARGAVVAGEAPGLAAFAARGRAEGALPAADLDARLVAEAELAGDPAAAVIMGHARRAFAAALVSLVDVFGPRLIVVGGTLARAQGERWLAPAREAVAREAFRTAAQRTHIVPAVLGDDVGLVGALPLWRGAALLHHPSVTRTGRQREPAARAAAPGPWRGATTS